MRCLSPAGPLQRGLPQPRRPGPRYRLRVQRRHRGRGRVNVLYSPALLGAPSPTVRERRFREGRAGPLASVWAGISGLHLASHSIGFGNVVSLVNHLGAWGGEVSLRSCTQSGALREEEALRRPPGESLRHRKAVGRGSEGSLLLSSMGPSLSPELLKR